MQLKFRILHFFLVLLLGVLGIIGLILFEVFGIETPPESVQVPKAATWVIRLNVTQLAKDEAYTLLFETKDDPFFKQLKSMTEERVEKRREYGSLSIDFRQPFLVFGAQEPNANYIGFLVKVVDEAAFKKNISKYLKKNQAATVKNNTALILSNQSNASPNNKQLQALAEKYMNNSRTESTKTNNGKAFMSFDVPKGQKNPMHLELQHDPHQLSFTGNFTAENNLKPANYSLKSNALLISSSIIPPGFSDSLNKLLPIGSSYQFPNLRAVTIDYQGVMIEKVRGGMLILPKANMILETETAISMEQLFASIPENLKAGDHTIQLGFMKYQVVQLDDHSIFVGIDPESIIRKKQTNLITVKGSFKPLLVIEGNRLVKAFMDMSPAIGAGRRFTNTAKDIHFIATQKGTKVSLEGTVNFQNDAYALHELIKMLVALGAVE